MVFEPEGEAQILKGSTRKGIAASAKPTQVAKPMRPSFGCGSAALCFSRSPTTATKGACWRRIHSKRLWESRASRFYGSAIFNYRSRFVADS